METVTGCRQRAGIVETMFYVMSLIAVRSSVHLSVRHWDHTHWDSRKVSYVKWGQNPEAGLINVILPLLVDPKILRKTAIWSVEKIYRFGWPWTGNQGDFSVFASTEVLACARNIRIVPNLLLGLHLRHDE